MSTHYAADLIIVFKTAGWMLATFAVPLALAALCAAAIKSASPGPHHQPGLKKGRNL